MSYCRGRDIYYDKERDLLHGPFMRADRISEYSPKIAACIRDVVMKSGKSFIYFNKVRVYGVLFICQVLKENGIIEYGDPV